VLDALRGLEFRNAVNMPMVDASVLNTIRPYLNLAEKVGSLQTQLAEDAISRVEIAIEGEEIESHIQMVTVAILKGMLDPILNKNVNYINAPYLAKERGIVVSQTSGLVKSDYPNIISCRVNWGSGERCVALTLFNSEEPRLVWIDNYRVDVRPEGTILVMQSTDRPGLIGEVGTILGQHDINIATWRTGRKEAGGTAISFVVVDSDVPAGVIQLLLELALVKRVKKIIL
jgi:D-3-phosphoglycerate dehydrogenase